MEFLNKKDMENYSLQILAEACDFADTHFHKKPSKNASDKEEKKLAIFLENLKNGKARNNNRHWLDKYEEYVKSRNYDWFTLKIR